MAKLKVTNKLPDTDIKVSDQKGCISNGKVLRNNHWKEWTIPDNYLPDPIKITPDSGRFPTSCNACYDKTPGIPYRPSNNCITIIIKKVQVESENGNNVTVGVDQPC